MRKQSIGPCASRRTWEGISQDFQNCRREEEFDEELTTLVNEFLLRQEASMGDGFPGYLYWE